jgi:signal peptidase I
LSESQNDKPEKKGSRKSDIKDFIEIVLFLGLAVLLVFSFNWILGGILHTDSPLVVVTSESMEPSYWGSNRPDFGTENDIRKDMLIVRGVDPSTIKVGDTIVFYRVLVANTSQLDYEREPIVHRVNRVYLDNVTGDYWFTTKGDNPATNDDFVEIIDIGELQIHEFRLIGKIVGRVPYLGGIISYFKGTPGRYVLIGIVAVVLVATFVFSSFGDKDEDVFEEEEEKVKKAEEVEKKSFLDNLKTFYKKTMKYKHIVFPSFVLIIIIFIPVIDTLAADWGSHFGVTEVVYDGAEQKTLFDGARYFAYADVTINCPGHWHQKFNSFTLQIINQTSGEILGEGNWTVVYNFEGTKTFSSGCWLDMSTVTIGANYNLTVTAHLQSKFGRTWTDIRTIDFALILR